MPTEDFKSVASPARQFVERIISHVASHSIRPTQERERFAESLRMATAGAADIPATFSALRAALPLLGDRHSRLVMADDTANDAEPVWPSGALIEGIAAVTLPGYFDDGLSPRFVAEGQKIIAALDAQKPTGWLVDLRGNRGGNLYAMLGALGPLLETADEADGLLGFFLTRHGREPFGYADGAVWAKGVDGRDVFARLPRKNTPYHLSRPPPAIAVLVGPQTASAAEMTAIALRGLGPHVRLFGAATKGQATLNRYIPDLPTDAAQIAITCATLADRTGKEHGYALTPDVLADDCQGVPEAAQRWLRNHDEIKSKEIFKSSGPS